MLIFSTTINILPWYFNVIHAAQKYPIITDYTSINLSYEALQIYMHNVTESSRSPLRMQKSVDFLQAFTRESCRAESICVSSNIQSAWQAESRQSGM